MKKLLLILLSVAILYGIDDIVVFKNEYKVLTLQGKLKRIVIGNKDVINVSILDNSQNTNTLLKIFGKKSGNTSILLMYKDGHIANYHVFVNQNLGFVEKMINHIAPKIKISRVGDGSIVLAGEFDDPHQKNKVYSLLESGGIELKSVMDITKTKKVNKMIRTKLYLVQIDNSKARELGGAVGLGIINQNANVSLNPDATTGVTFSGWLLDNAQQFSTQTGHSLLGTLKLLQTKGVAQILDDTILITTEDRNASFHVGGDVYIPVGITQTNGGYPTIQLEEKEYGLRLTLTTTFMDKQDYMHLKVEIKDSEFDPNKEHYVKLGGDNGAFSDGIEVPSFLSKHITTDIVAKSNQVIALGGRLHTEQTDTEEKIPILGDIPLIGWMFKSTVKGKRTNDLLFFLIPEIVDANDNIDDSNFYEKIKQQRDIFSKRFEPKEEKEEKTNEQNATKELEPITIEIEDEQEPKEVITIYDEQKEEVQTIKPLTKEPQQEIKIQKALPQKLKADNKNIPQKAQPKKTISQESKQEKLYAVNTGKIFIRTKPNGKTRLHVWKKGHRFMGGEEKQINNITWLKITQDCFSTPCKKTKQELWISKKYTKLLENNNKAI
jgi:pilus assembly protein CpaC